MAEFNFADSEWDLGNEVEIVDLVQETSNAPQIGSEEGPNVPEFEGQQAQDNSPKSNETEAVSEGAAVSSGDSVPPRVKCPSCNKDYLRRGGMLEHYKDKHPGQALPPLCPRTQAKSSELKKYKCKECPFTYITRGGLRQHRIKKHPESLAQESSWINDL